MAAYILRRLGALLVTIFGSTFLVYNLTAISSDPTSELRLSTDPNRDFLVAALTRELQLDVPPPARYFLWLKGVLGVFVGNPDFGTGRDGAEVSASLAMAIPVSVRLVFAATIFAIIVGIAIGIITALRQYSRFDYSMTFYAFLLYSLPVFWVAVLLKEYLAIQFNNFLREPNVPTSFIIGFGLIIGLILAAVIGGERKRFWTTFVVVAGFSSCLLTFLGVTNWFLNPSLGPVAIGILAVGIAFGVTQLSVGLINKAALRSSLTMAAIVFLEYFPIDWVFDTYPGSLTIFLIASVNIVLAIFVALAYSKIDRTPIIRTAVLTVFISSGLLYLDKLMQTWKPYMETDAINYRPVPTIGQRNSLLESSDWWINSLDIATHLFLPTLALTLLGFAGYIRFTRGTLLEVLNSDYIRTARAKGLPERTVIMRHAFKNTMIPLTTIGVGIIPDIIGGALITESVFGWSGMGTLFRQGLLGYDLNLLMGVLFLISTLTLLANLTADLLYSVVDPRIRAGSGE